MPHPNEIAIRKLYEAASSGDIAAIQSLFAPTIAWHEPGKNPTSGDYKGIDEFMGFFGVRPEERPTYSTWRRERSRSSGTTRATSTPRTSSGAEARATRM
jgi:ketosteroid isomerase-like protein